MCPCRLTDRPRDCGSRNAGSTPAGDAHGGVLGVVYQPGFENPGSRKARVGSNPTASATGARGSMDRARDSGS